MVRYAAVCPICNYRVKLNADGKTFSSHYDNITTKTKCPNSGNKKPK
jgi:hypothetical protein